MRLNVVSTLFSYTWDNFRNFSITPQGIARINLLAEHPTWWHQGESYSV